MKHVWLQCHLVYWKWLLTTSGPRAPRLYGADITPCVDPTSSLSKSRQLGKEKVPLKAKTEAFTKQTYPIPVTARLPTQRPKHCFSQSHE